MKVIKVEDETHSRLTIMAKETGQTIGVVIKGLLDAERSQADDIYSDYAKSLHSRIDKIITAIEANGRKNQPVERPETPPQTNNSEQACCAQSRPCKHWVWDTSTGDGYVNTLSGQIRSTL